MSIMDGFSNYNLTNDQVELVNKLDAFLNDRSQNCFLLKGYAGTGKTFITKGLTEYFKEVGRTYILAAPTGKASKVIAQKTGSEAYTIHKTIYSDTAIKEFKVSNIDRTETYKFYYELNVNNDPAQTVYIIDEASMISDIYSEAEFFRFGSGYLLEDLLKYINLDNNDQNKKIIFIGDNAQLPPIGMKFSPALDEQYLLDKRQTKVTSFELTEVIRQTKDSGILQNSFKMRKALANGIFNQLDFDLNYPDVQHIEHGDLMGEYLKSCGNKINGESIVIAYSNTSVAEYNKQIRSHFFPGQTELTPGDKVLVTTNISVDGLFISNGDFGLVKEVAHTPERKTITIKRKSEDSDKIEDIIVPLSFREVVIGFNDLQNQPHYIRCKIVENLLYSTVPNLSSDESKAIYVDFVIRNKYLKPGTKEFKDALRSDPYFNALKVKFGYAITCHKAQGSEWKNVFVNCKTHMSSLNAHYFRWLYTAITRSSKLLYALEEPHIKPGSDLKYIDVGIDDYSLDSNGTVNKADDSNETLDELFGIPPSNRFLVRILQTITNVVKQSGIRVADIQHKQYQEIYYFSEGEETVRFNIYYNGKKEISSIAPQVQSELSNKLETLLTPLLHKRVVLKPENGPSQPSNFEFQELFLQEFYENLSAVLKAENVKIENITPLSWQQRYMFSRNEEIASFDFYYNGKKQFTKFVENKKDSTSEILIRDLVPIIKKNL